MSATQTCDSRDVEQWATARAARWVPLEEWVRLAENLLGEGNTGGMVREALGWARLAVKSYNVADYLGAWISLQYAAYFQRCLGDWLARAAVEDALLSNEDRYGVRGAEYVQQAEDRACSANGGK